MHCFLPGFSQVSVNRRKSKEYEVKSFKMKFLFTTDLALMRAMRTKRQSVHWEARCTGQRFSSVEPHLQILTGRRQGSGCLVPGMAGSSKHLAKSPHHSHHTSQLHAASYFFYLPFIFTLLSYTYKKFELVPGSFNCVVTQNGHY